MLEDHCLPRGAQILTAPSPSYDAASFPGCLCWIPWREDPLEAPSEPAGPRVEAGEAPARRPGAPCGADCGGVGLLPAVTASCSGSRAGIADVLPCLWLRAEQSAKVMLYLHSSAEDIGAVYGTLQALREQLQVSVLAPEYPGYGLLGALQTTERGCLQAALAALRFLVAEAGVDCARLLLCGRTMGSAPALFLASRFPVGGVVLVNAFTSAHDVARKYVGSHLAHIGFGDFFTNRHLMGRVSSPVLLIHALRDTTVPMLHSAKLFELCRARKSLVTPEKMRHGSDLLESVDFFLAPAMRFFGLPCCRGRPPQLPLAVFVPPEPPPASLRDPAAGAAAAALAALACLNCAGGPQAPAASACEEAAEWHTLPPAHLAPCGCVQAACKGAAGPVEGCVQVGEALPAGEPAAADAGCAVPLTAQDPFCGRWTRAPRPRAGKERRQKGSSPAGALGGPLQHKRHCRI